MHYWKPCFVIALVVFSILVASKVIFTNYFGMGYLFSEITVLRTVELPNRERIDKQKWKSRFDVDIMKCLDDISSRLRENSKECEKQSKLKIFFVGDSRIRQEFYSFLRLIPEHDRKWNGQPNETIISHYDMSVWHGLLNLEVKFFWRHLITDKLVAEIKGLVRKMDSSDCHTGPRLILMGINAHHLFPENGADYRTYRAMIEKLKAPLKELANLTTVLWMANQKVMDYVFPSYLPNYVNEGKVRGLNNFAYEAFNNSRITLFSPSSSKVDDYTRSCSIRRRTDYYQYFNCLHWVHLGYSVIYYNSLQWLSVFCSTQFQSYGSS